MCNEDDNFRFEMRLPQGAGRGAALCPRRPGAVDWKPAAARLVGYSYDTLVLLGLAQYVINLGYRAVATMNDTALAIPYALKAGLGEYGRHGLLIT